MTFGERLRKLMKSRGIKAITLAQRMGVSCAYVSQLITGIRRPGRETLLKLSKSLEVPLETLLMMESDVSDISDRILISRRVPVLDEAKVHEWTDFMDLDYPALVATAFEYATTDDPKAFYINAKGIAWCCGLEACDLILIEPGREVSSGDTVFMSMPQGFAIRKFIVKDEITLFMDDKQEPLILSKENKEGFRYYRVSQCLKKL